MTDDPVLKAQPESSGGPLMSAYASAEVGNDARGRDHGRDLSKPDIDEPSLFDTIRRAFAEFLGIPFAICVGGVVLAVLASIADHDTPSLLGGIRSWLTSKIFTDTDSSVGALEMMAGGMFGLSTITFSMLLIALQQSAGATGMQVADGFISRKRNQAVLGFLLGTTIFVVLSRVLGDAETNPALAAFLSLVFTLLSVFVLAMLFFMVTNQSRPNFVVDDLRARILKSRRKTHSYLVKTRRVPLDAAIASREVTSNTRGYISDIDFEALSRMAPSGTEIELVCEIGDYMIQGDPVAKLRGLKGMSEGDILGILTFDSQRSLQTDPTAGLANLSAMSWRTGSAAQQNQETTLNAINAMSDIMVHWLHDEPVLNGGSEWNVVYPDTALLQLFDALEDQLVVANESQQTRPVAHIYSLVARTLDWMRPEVMDRACDMVVRSLGLLQKHTLTLNLERTIIMLANTLREHERHTAATEVEEALQIKRESLGL